LKLNWFCLGTITGIHAFLNVYIFIDPVHVPSTSWFNTAYDNFNSMKRSCICKYKSKEIRIFNLFWFFFVKHYSFCEYWFKMCSDSCTINFSSDMLSHIVFFFFVVAYLLCLLNRRNYIRFIVSIYIIVLKYPHWMKTISWLECKQAVFT